MPMHQVQLHARYRPQANVRRLEDLKAWRLEGATPDDMRVA
jgi:hypothetical protein